MRVSRRFKAIYPKTIITALALYCAVATLAMAQAHPAAAPSDRYSAIVIEASSGRVLSQTNPDAERFPASLTKLMTLYLTFEALRDHRVEPDELVPVSPHAASQEPSKLGLVPGSRITVHQAELGLVTRSANDAASALAELIGGSEDHFAQMMTLRAHALGMTHTIFRNANGLPNPEQVSTARDLALLARHIIQDFPDQYPIFSTPSFIWHGQVIANHDHLLKSYPGADGLKTGYTDAAGHNLVTSAVRGNIRLIGVVLGANSNLQRDLRMEAQLNAGYAQLGVAPEPPPRPVNVKTFRKSSRDDAELASRPRPARWSIQIGRFAIPAAAKRAAEAAARTTAGAPRINRVATHGRVFYAAQVIGLREAEASAYCRRRQDCLVFRPAR